MNRRQALGAALSAAVLSGCVAPAIDSGAFTKDAKKALTSTLSETRTAHLVVSLLLNDKITGPAADTALSNAEDAIGPISDSFGKVQPPAPRDDALRSRVLTLIEDASSAIADARIAARRGDEAGLRKARSGLDSVSSDIEETDGGLR